MEKQEKGWWANICIWAVAFFKSYVSSLFTKKQAIKLITGKVMGFIVSKASFLAGPVGLIMSPFVKKGTARLINEAAAYYKKGKVSKAKKKLIKASIQLDKEKNLTIAEKEALDVEIIRNLTKFTRIK